MIFFDIDGTLLDYDYAEKQGIIDFFHTQREFSHLEPKPLIELWNRISSEYFQLFLDGSLSFQEQKQKRMKRIFKKVNLTILNEEADQKFGLYLQHFQRNWTVYNDVRKCLDFLKNKGFELGIISNGDYNQQVHKLKQIGIHHYFSHIITSSQVGVAKPDSKIFKEAAIRMNQDTKECYYVGDRLDTDAVGSKNAGMTGIWINRIDDKKHKDIITIHSLSQLEKAIKVDFNHTKR
ncbi:MULTISPECIES: HAD family hydrolase [Bacillus]|uniref:HAD family hydrolase n=1 Tax=Bacillus pseudomycoides TaxID=64104 RepID=A0A1Y3MF61_9BACI|nr:MULTISPECIES: HAD family hydrolase [Bacillus cereus group]EOP60737.1 haloacid dehalogenase, type II [Bacillus cereus VD136]EOQ04562.1 haloacid dehalogenase, type II [Bacillus cereus VDM021]MDF2085704.1 HAD family hydrolase [Bacillus pseudomycoides]OUM49075.1 HAD family hydrolase [Bacillus pseudomycoides]PEL25292.1 HAD family hydrolase [Bacillus pseudomycoides]